MLLFFLIHLDIASACWLGLLLLHRRFLPFRFLLLLLHLEHELVHGYCVVQPLAAILLILLLLFAIVVRLLASMVLDEVDYVHHTAYREIHEMGMEESLALLGPV
jgi:hypothetical protein